MKALRAVNNYLASASLTLAMLIIFIMVTALFLSAATRFITGTGFAWFIELPPVLVSWLVFPLLGPLLKKGQHIKQGDIIGTVGSTGRATGAHLDIRLNWFQTRLDPATVLNIKN